MADRETQLRARAYRGQRYAEFMQGDVVQEVIGELTRRLTEQWLAAKDSQPELDALNRRRLGLIEFTAAIKDVIKDGQIAQHDLDRMVANDVGRMAG